MQLVMWVSGLRGAMAYALALKCATQPDVLPLGPVILIVTLLYSFITILGVGSVLHPVLTACDVKRKVVDPDLVPEIAYESKDGCCQRFKKRMVTFDRDYFSPLFIK